MDQSHVPVLFHDVLAALRPHSGGKYLDGTVGGGGHAAGILSLSSPDGVLLGMDRDPAAIEHARAVLAPFGDRASVVRASYAEMGAVARSFAPVDGVLLDLGLSSLQLEDPARGFSFQADGPLDMRFDPDSELTAAEVVNDWPVEELADVLFRYGEERFSRKIARAIGAARPLSSTRELAEVIARAVGWRRRTQRIHPATRTFQALRIVVNGELEALEAALPAAVSLLKPVGRLVVISFHSLEDRIVKRFIRSRRASGHVSPSTAALEEVTRKPVVPTDEEIARNPRARSAKMRVAERLPALA